MNPDTSLHKKLFKACFLSALTLFLIPALTYIFTLHAMQEQDAQFLRMVQERTYASKDASSQQKEDNIAFYRARPPSAICSNTEEEAKEYREAICEPYGQVWQFHTMRVASGWTLLGGIAVLLCIAVLGGLAFVNRKLQYASFVLGKVRWACGCRFG
jgi:hypothetical protein